MGKEIETELAAPRYWTLPGVIDTLERESVSQCGRLAKNYAKEQKRGG